MLNKCGKKCFLGPNKSFPICAKNTCKVNAKGVYAAYMRARQYSSKGQKYRNIAKKANKMLIKMDAKR
jgi:DICT domain-containing protein